MSKYQRPQVFSGDFDAVRAGHRTLQIRHDCVDGGSGELMFWPDMPVAWAASGGEPVRGDRWRCGACKATWKDERVKAIAVQDPGGTFWRQEVAGV